MSSNDNVVKMVHVLLTEWSMVQCHVARQFFCTSVQHSHDGQLCICNKDLNVNLDSEVQTFVDKPRLLLHKQIHIAQAAG